MCESRWPSWAVRPNEPSGLRGRKAILNCASALVTTCPSYVNWHLRTLSITSSSSAAVRSRVTRTMSVALLLSNKWSKRSLAFRAQLHLRAHDLLNCHCSAQQLKEQLRNTLVATQRRGDTALTMDLYLHIYIGPWPCHFYCSGGGPRPPRSSGSVRAVEPSPLAPLPPPPVPVPNRPPRPCGHIAKYLLTLQTKGENSCRKTSPEHHNKDLNHLVKCCFTSTETVFCTTRWQAYTGLCNSVTGPHRSESIDAGILIYLVGCFMG